MLKRLTAAIAAATLAAACLALAVPAQAQDKPAPAVVQQAPDASADPALEKRVLAIAAELRCLVCQNETIAASHADLAVDLRNQVRDMLRAGQSERQIYDYMTARYGDFVLYRPPLKQTTALLWFGPFVFLAIGLISLWWMLRKRNRLPPERFEPDDNI